MSIRSRLLTPLLLLALACLACRAVMGAWDAPMASTSTPSQVFTLATRAQAASHTVAPSAASVSPSTTLSPSPTPFPPTATLTLPASATVDSEAAARQVQVFEELWNAVDGNYLYPDFNGLDWDAIHAEYLGRIDRGLSEDDFYLAMAEMVSRLGDDHSAYFSPAEAARADAEYEGAFDYVGIGVVSIVTPECNCVTLTLVFPGSPAERSGLQAHDSIFAVDGQPILDENGLRRDLLRGLEGTRIQLTVQSPGGSPRQVSMERQRISGPLPVPYQALSSPSGKRIGYIFIPTFNDSNIDEGVGQALEAMNAAGQLDGVILDLRQNGGGSSDVLANALAYFTDGLVGHFIDRQGQRPLSVQAVDSNSAHQIPLVALVGPSTASFGEIFAGILKDMGRAYLIGERTDGNVEVLNIYNFSDGSRAWIAHATFRPLNHPEQDWEQTGIAPHLVIPVNWAEVTLQSDPAILAALEHFDRQ